MKKLIIILFLFISIIASATDYYVKTGGNDSNTGLSDGQAWATITKVNTVWAAGTFAPGDNIYFNRGDTFTGTITPTESGSAGNTITVGAYGTGADPIISGFTTLSSWTNEGGGIYSKVVSTSIPTDVAAIVSFDGTNQPMGRWPDATWNTTATWNSTTQLTDAANLNSGTLNWTGAEVVVKTNMYYTVHPTITSHSGAVLVYSPNSIYTPSAGYGYFIQNDLKTVTAYKEWYYNRSTSTLYLYFGAELPTDHTVKLASVQNAVAISGYNYITFDNINFEGFSNDVFNLNACTNITVQNCAMSYVGNDVFDGRSSGTGTSSYLMIDSNTMNEINGNAIELVSQFTYLTIKNNTINNVGLLFGSGRQRAGDHHHAIVVGANGITPAFNHINSVIEYNNITNIGHTPIYYYGSNITVRYNFIDTYGLTEDDCGGIYTYNWDGSTTTSTITYNIVINGLGNISGTTTTAYGRQTYGIYLDGQTNAATITFNTIANNTYSGGWLSNGGSNCIANDNTFYGCWLQFRTNAAPSVSVQRNQFVSVVSGAYCWFHNHAYSTITTLDYNYYIRPISNSGPLIIYLPSGSYVYYTLAQWRTVTGKDAHSITAPRTISSTDDIRIIYNNTTSNQTYTLSTTMYDPTNTGYSGSLILSPFTSKVLIGAGTVTLYEEEEALVVLTTSVTGGTTNATVGGNVINEGESAVTEKGVCWSISANPTTADSHISNGSGLGTYNVLITGLSPSTTYHARAYAINGTSTGYGADTEFTTTTDEGLSGDPIFINGKILMKNDGGIWKVVIK